MQGLSGDPAPRAAWAAQGLDSLLYLEVWAGESLPRVSGPLGWRGSLGNLTIILRPSLICRAGCCLPMSRFPHRQPGPYRRLHTGWIVDSILPWRSSRLPVLSPLTSLTVSLPVALLSVPLSHTRPMALVLREWLTRATQMAQKWSEAFPGSLEVSGRGGGGSG